MLDLLTRRRSPRALIGVMVLSWIATVSTMEAGDAVESAWLHVPMALVMIAGLAISATCLVLLLVQSLRR